jgi:hypothetical protein
MYSCVIPDSKLRSHKYVFIEFLSDLPILKTNHMFLITSSGIPTAGCSSCAVVLTIRRLRIVWRTAPCAIPCGRLRYNEWSFREKTDLAQQIISNIKSRCGWLLQEVSGHLDSYHWTLSFDPKPFVVSKQRRFHANIGLGFHGSRVVLGWSTSPK